MVIASGLANRHEVALDAESWRLLDRSLGDLGSSGIVNNKEK
jgi:hypothetical protein